MLKVIHVGSGWHPYKGGGALRVVNIIENLVQFNNCQVYLITETPDEMGSYAQEKHDNLWIYRCSSIYQMLKTLLKICRQESIDLIHAHNARIGLFCLLLKRQMPLIVELHALPEINFFKKILTKYVLKKSQAIIVLAEAAKRKLVIDYLIKPEKIYVLVNGIDREKFQISRQLKEGLMTVGYLGTFYDWQGVIDFVKAIPIVLKQYKDVNFLMVGDGPAFNEVKELIKILKIESKVTLPGRVGPQEALQYLSQMDIFVMPRPSTLATETTIPLKMFEALAIGLPIVASNVSGLAEVLTDQKDALIHQAGDINDLAQKILILLKDDNLRNKLSKNALENPYLKNSWQIVAKKLMNIYYNALSLKR